MKRDHHSSGVPQWLVKSKTNLDSSKNVPTPKEREKMYMLGRQRSNVIQADLVWEDNSDFRSKLVSTCTQ